jgi:hypothetical protein
MTSAIPFEGPGARFGTMEDSKAPMSSFKYRSVELILMLRFA